MLMFDESAEREIHRARAVVYDRKSGRIVHVHEIRTLDGAERPAAGAAAERALALARHLAAGMKGVVVSRLAALETGLEGDIDAATHRVDPKARRVTAIAKAARKAGRARK